MNSEKTLKNYERDLDAEIKLRKALCQSAHGVELRRLRYTLVGLELSKSMLNHHKEGGELPADA